MSNITEFYPKMLPLKEASRLSGLSYDRLRKMCINNEVAHFKTGAKWLINYADLCDLLDGKRNYEGNA